MTAAVKRLLPLLLLLAVCSAHAAEPRFSVPVGDSAVLGPAGASVTLVEFIDYQ